MVEFLVIAVIGLLLLSMYLGWQLYQSYKDYDEVSLQINQLTESIDELNEIEAAARIDLSDRDQVNPQHFRPMYDSQGPLFNTEVTVIPVNPTEEEMNAITGECDRPESDQATEATTNGVLRSSPVS